MEVRGKGIFLGNSNGAAYRKRGPGYYWHVYNNHVAPRKPSVFRAHSEEDADDWLDRFPLPQKCLHLRDEVHASVLVRHTRLAQHLLQAIETCPPGFIVVLCTDAEADACVYSVRSPLLLAGPRAQEFVASPIWLTILKALVRKRPTRVSRVGAAEVAEAPKRRTFWDILREDD